MNAWWDLSGSWVLELLSAALSAASLFALVGVLAYANGRILVPWHNLTLNTVVSILSTISRLCAVFVLGESIAQVKWAIFTRSAQSLMDFETIDAASRGPMGAFWLLARRKKIAMMGATAVLLALAFDPFAQQLVRLKQNGEDIYSASASLPQALRYSLGNRVAVSAVAGLQRGDGFQAVTATADFAMQSAILFGLSQSLDDVTQQLRLACPTGNCTWPATESLSVCSTCNDVSSKLDKSSSTGSSSAVALETSNAAASFGQVTKFELPNRLFIDNFDTIPPQLLMTTFGTGNQSETISMSSIDTLIWAMAILRVKPEDQTRTWPDTRLEATECALHYCVQRYETQVANSNISETASIVTEATRDRESWKPLQSSIESYRATLTDAEIQSLAFEDSLSAIERTDLSLGGGKFNVSQAAVNGLSSFFHDTFAANVTQINDTNGYYMRATSTQYAPASLQPLVNATDIPGLFAALALSMSNAMRAADDKRTVVAGRYRQWVTRYEVHWPWIVLPLAVVLATVAQLVITMRMSRDAPLWKNSSLAVMSRGRYVSDVFRDDAATVTAMQTAVGKRRVNLFPEGAQKSALRRPEGTWRTPPPDAQASTIELVPHPSPYLSTGLTRESSQTDINQPPQYPLSKL